jgi:hypothetical protein
MTHYRGHMQGFSWRGGDKWESVPAEKFDQITLYRAAQFGIPHAPGIRQ